MFISKLSLLFSLCFYLDFTNSYKYTIKRYPLFAATPTEFARVISENPKNIIFDSSQNRQFCALEIQWFEDDSQEVINI